MGTDLNKVKVSLGGGVYFTPGNYVAKVEAVRRFNTKADDKEVVAVDFLILESDSTERKPNTRVGTVFDRTTAVGNANLKEFLIAASGLSPTNVEDEDKVNAANWMEILESASGEDQTLKGLKIRVRGVTQAKKKKVGETFCRVFYAPHEETRAALVDAE